MPITIRNKETEELIRKIGRRTGEGPSAVVRRLAENENARTSTASPQEIARRRKVFADLRSEYPPPEPRMTWTEIEREMDALFDYLDDEPEKSSAS